MDKKSLLEDTCKKIEKEITSINYSQTICCYIPFNRQEQKYLSLFYYEKNLFVGIYNSKTNVISFDGDELSLFTLNTYSMDSLYTRIEASMRDIEIERENKIKAAWNEKIPLLNKIIELKNNINELPKERQDYIYSNLIYDKKIDDLINNYETQEKNNEKYEIDF